MLLELHELIAFRGPIARADRGRHDAERRQHPRKAVGADRLASLPFFPGTALDTDQSRDQLRRGETVYFLLDEDRGDIS